MNERDFIYWLSGFLESGAKTLTEEQVKTIKDHLGFVVNKVTPDNYRETITINPSYPMPSITCSSVSP